MEIIYELPRGFWTNAVNGLSEFQVSGPFALDGCLEAALEWRLWEDLILCTRLTGLEVCPEMGVSLVIPC